MIGAILSGNNYKKVHKQITNNMTREELEASVINWADDKDLLRSENVTKQTLKFISEAGELADGVAKGHEDEIIDAIGDCEVVLTILKAQLGYHQNEPLGIAWNEIKNRKGRTVNGTFIKEN